MVALLTGLASVAHTELALLLISEAAMATLAFMTDRDRTVTIVGVVWVVCITALLALLLLTR